MKDIIFLYTHIPQIINYNILYGVAYYTLQKMLCL